jgi:hypothetical protein
MPLTGSAATTLTVGERQDILTITRPADWPDGTMGVVKTDTTYTFWAANGLVGSSPVGGPVRLTGTLDNPVSGGATTQSITNLLDAFNYVGGGPVYQHSSGLLLMFYHTEKWPGGNAVNFWASIGMAKSTDGGDTWTDLGLIITHQTPFDPNATYSADIGSGSFVVKREADGNDYFYTYFQNRVGNGADFNIVNLSVARAKVSDVVSAANANATPVFKKYCKGNVNVGTFRARCSSAQRPWGEPGLGGISSPLEARNLDAIFTAVSYNRYLRKYILLANAAQPGFDWPASDIVYLESRDGLKWSRRKIVVHQPNTLAFYPSIIDPGSDPQTTGQNFYLYYVYSESPTTEGIIGGALSRRSISFK